MDLKPILALLIITAYFLAFKLLLGSAVLGLAPFIALLVFSLALGLLLSLAERNTLPAVSSMIAVLHIFLLIFAFLPLAVGVDLVLGV